MKSKVKVQIPAKINFTLDVFGVENGFHNINSLVASIGIFDAITLAKRNDDQIVLVLKGREIGCPVCDNNAFKTYKLLKETYHLTGATITLEKNIPVGGGMGGSSADIAGVILSTEKLFGIDIDRKAVADKLGSDVMYMLGGGWAIISDRGNTVEKLKVDKTFYINAIDNKVLVKAKEVYKLFDEKQVKTKNSTKKAKQLLLQDSLEFLSVLSNDLANPAIEIAPVIKESLNQISLANAKFVTGSGSAVVGVYTDRKVRDKEYKLLKEKNLSVLKTQTL